MSEKLVSEQEQKLRIKELKRNAKEKKAEFEIKELEQKEQQLNIKLQKQSEKKAIEALNEEGRFGTKGEPRKSLSTFFRNQNKLDISIISILDRKVAILIRICTTIISALIVFHDYVDSNVDNGHLISIVLIVGLMITLVLSILATKPFVSKMKKIRTEQVHPVYPNIEENIFMGTQVQCTLEEYERAMHKLVKSQDLQLGNQIRASYIISQNNAFKSKLVDWAFNIFLCSFLAVGLIYIVTKFS